LVIFTSHEYLVKVIIFFQCVSLVELNPWEHEWLIVIQALQEGKMKAKKSTKKGKKKKKKSSLWAIHQHLQIGCKFKREKNHKSWSPWFLIFLIINFSPFFMYLKHVQGLVLDFKLYFIQNFNILVKINCMLIINHISFNLLSTYMYHTKVLKTLRFLCACYYLRVHDSHSSAFLFHLFIQLPYLKA
jgi:hypothetical protein